LAGAAARRRAFEAAFLDGAVRRDFFWTLRVLGRLAAARTAAADRDEVFRADFRRAERLTERRAVFFAAMTLPLWPG
jgi:hypothetical protein